MAELTIELNDVGLRVAQPGSDRPLAIDGAAVESPGYALVTRKDLSLGMTAYQQALLQPLDVQNRFWDQLSTDPAADRYNQAELAFAHLQQIWQQTGTGVESVWASVPACYEPYQLGLLHGICRELALPLQSVVAAPVLIQGDFRRAVHLDLTLHRCVFSLVEQSDQVDLVHAISDPNLGWLALTRQWVKGLANEFVRNTRFDPLYQADSEQNLHARLEPLLLSLQTHDSTAIELSGHRITLMRTMLSEWVHGPLTSMTSALKVFLREQQWDQVDRIYLSDRLGLVPGIARLLEQQIGGEVECLSESPAVALARSRHAFQAPPADQLTFQTARRLDGPPVLPPVS